MSTQELALFVRDAFYKAHARHGISEGQIIKDCPYESCYCIRFEEISSIPFVKLLDEYRIWPEALEIHIPPQDRELDFRDLQKTVTYAQNTEKELILVIDDGYNYVGSSRISRAYEVDKIIILPIVSATLKNLHNSESADLDTFDADIERHMYFSITGKA
jgi:hypothetical protein